MLLPSLLTAIRQRRSSMTTMMTRTWTNAFLFFPGVLTNGFVLSGTKRGSGTRSAFLVLRLPRPPPRPRTASTRVLSTAQDGSSTTFKDDDIYHNNDDDRSLFSHVAVPPTSRPTLGLTQNLGLTYTQSGSACLDLYFDTTPGIIRTDLERSLALSWNEVRAHLLIRPPLLVHFSNNLFFSCFRI
jgi:hypothetical protein